MIKNQIQLFYLGQGYSYSQIPDYLLDKCFAIQTSTILKIKYFFFFQNHLESIFLNLYNLKNRVFFKIGLMPIVFKNFLKL
jgi:hypothetical protein